MEQVGHKKKNHWILQKYDDKEREQKIENKLSSYFEVLHSHLCTNHVVYKSHIMVLRFHDLKM